MFILILVLCSCNKISKKPISEKLTTEELSKAIKSDPFFADFYENIRNSVGNMSDVEKATYNDISFRRLFKYVKFLQDTTYWNPLYEEWEKEWKSEYGFYLPKADSILNYWKEYLEENSLNKYVNIELATIDKEYYSYIGGIKNVYLGFRLNPLQGTIEQIQFTYGFQPKIYDGEKNYIKNRCYSTTPFSFPVVRFWEVDYSNEDIFANYSEESFLRDYNLFIEITKIRKDGKNISIDDLNVPEIVSVCIEYKKDYPLLFEFYKEDMIKALINKDYQSKMDYLNKKSSEVKEQKDKLCFDFYEEYL